MLDSNAIAAERAVEQFCAENERLAHTFDALPSPGHAHDAASFLSTRIAFDDHPGSFTLSAPLSAAMDDSGWRRFSGEELNGLDFRWMHELLAYDHWSLENTNVFHDAPGGLLDAPMPDYRQLQLWVSSSASAMSSAGQPSTCFLRSAARWSSSGVTAARSVSRSPEQREPARDANTRSPSRRSGRRNQSRAARRVCQVSAMRLLFVVGWLAAGVALADVPGPQTVCDGPKCTVCTDTACANTALDAGLLLSECTSKNLTYYCPPGEDAVARCGCASTPANILLGLGALAALLRKRR